jgi:hypothetical protein
MDASETKPMQATCLARQGTGISEADIYTVRRRAESYHMVPQSVPRKGMLRVGNGFSQEREYIRAGLQVQRCTVAGPPLGQGIEGRPLGLGIV